MPTLLLPVLALIAITPNPIALSIGTFNVYWYGVCYAVGLAASYTVITREARRRGLNARLVDNGIIIIAAAALAGGRAYHVIDQWQLYQDNLFKIFLPPSTAASSPARSPGSTSSAAGSSRSGSGRTSSRRACS
jgi:hypothetical protein